MKIVYVQPWVGDDGSYSYETGILEYSSIPALRDALKIAYKNYLTAREIRDIEYAKASAEVKAIRETPEYEVLNTQYNFHWQQDKSLRKAYNILCNNIKKELRPEGWEEAAAKAKSLWDENTAQQKYFLALMEEMTEKIHYPEEPNKRFTIGAFSFEFDQYGREEELMKRIEFYDLDTWLNLKSYK